MAFLITRTYEADVNFFGFGVDEDEAHVGAGTIIIGLETNASDINNLSAGTEITIVQGDVQVVMSLTGRENLLATVVVYTYTLTSGDIANLVDEASTYITDDPSLIPTGGIPTEPSNLNFGTPERFDDDTIKIPFNFVDGSGNPENIVIVEVSDFDITEVEVKESFIEGEDDAYNLFVIPKAETSGVMEIEMTGKVYKESATAVGDSQVPVSPILLVPYNTIEPRISGSLLASTPIAGTNSIYVDINRDVLGVNPYSFEVSGADVGQPKIYAAPNPSNNLPDGVRPLPSLYVEYNNSDTPRRYFRLDFEFTDPPPIGGLNILLLDNAVSGYIDPNATTNIP